MAPTVAAIEKAKRTMAMRRSLPHMSGTALVEFIKFAKATNLSTVASSRPALDRAKALTLDDTPYGPLFLEVTLFSTPPYPNRKAFIVNPCAYLYKAFGTDGGFFKMMRAQLQEHRNTSDTPWRLVLYADEVVPGNQLASVNSRKIWVMYFSFLECGLHLHNELAWAPLLAEPSIDLKHVDGGISQIFGASVKSFFGGNTFDLERGGIVLTGPDGSRIRFYAKLGMIVQDGGAHKLIWSCKGDAGARLCMLCLNLVSKTSKLTDHDGDRSLPANQQVEGYITYPTRTQENGGEWWLRA